MLYFVHGLNGSSRDWDDFIHFFQKNGFECYAVELKKDMDLKKTHFMDFVDTVSNLISEEDIVIGHSMGGLIMQKVLERKNCKAGIGICSAPPTGINLESVSFFRQIRYLPFIALGIPFKPSFGLVRSVFLSGWDEALQRKIYDRLQKQSAHVTYEVMKQKIAIDETMISCPLYFIGRRQDVTIPIEVVGNIAKKYDASFDIVEGNHYIFIDWKEIAQKILSFIQQLDDRN
jgi:pimeloyl-ACP methyl ester carboxylesterase